MTKLLREFRRVKNFDEKLQAHIRELSLGREIKGYDIIYGVLCKTFEKLDI